MWIKNFPKFVLDFLPWKVGQKTTLGWETNNNYQQHKPYHEVVQCRPKIMGSSMKVALGPWKFTTEGFLIECYKNQALSMV